MGDISKPEAVGRGRGNSTHISEYLGYILFIPQHFFEHFFGNSGLIGLFIFFFKNAQENFKKCKKAKLTSSEMDDAMNDIFDEIQGESDFCSLILPLEKTLQEKHPNFYKNCHGLVGYQPETSVIKTLLESEPYLFDYILEARI